MKIFGLLFEWPFKTGFTVVSVFYSLGFQDCIARGRTDIVLKARLIFEHHLQQLSMTDTNTDSQMTDNSMEEVYARLTDVLQNSFLKNYPEAKGLLITKNKSGLRILYKPKLLHLK